MIAIGSVLGLLFLLGASPANAFVPSQAGETSQILTSLLKPSQYKSARRPLGSSESSSNEDEGILDSNSNDEDDFMASLRSRVQEVEDSATKLPLMVLDTMLPRQVLQIQIEHPVLVELIRDRLRKETPTLGMLGMARVKGLSQPVPLRSGVEVQIIQMEKSKEGNDWDVALRAGRRFRIKGEVEKTEQGWTEARVEFVDSQEQEEKEVESGDDRLTVARAIAKSRQFTDPNATLENNASLVDRWIELARRNERQPGQIDALLIQVGEIPPEHEPTERAMWVGALINPLPALGVAMEIRPTLLVAKSAEDRVQVALEGILKSIRHMDGTARMS